MYKTEFPNEAYAKPQGRVMCYEEAVIFIWSDEH